MIFLHFFGFYPSTLCRISKNVRKLVHTSKYKFWTCTLMSQSSSSTFQLHTWRMEKRKSPPDSSEERTTGWLILHRPNNSDSCRVPESFGLWSLHWVIGLLKKIFLHFPPTIFLAIFDDFFKVEFANGPEKKKRLKRKPDFRLLVPLPTPSHNIKDLDLEI